jgi:maleamate amidohydrolase
MNPWDDLPFTDGERERYARAGLGHRIELGVAPALLVVDMNRAFADSRFPLGDGEAAAPAVEAIALLLARARGAGIPVIFTTTFTTPHRAVAGLWKGELDEAGRALLDSPEAHEIADPIAPRDDEVVIPKARPSAFWQTGLADLLTYHRVDTVVVTGMVTSGCIRATVVDAFSHNYRVVVPQEAVADRSALSHKVNLFDMHMKYADVLPVSDVGDYLDAVECSRRAASTSRSGTART